MPPRPPKVFPGIVSAEKEELFDPEDYGLAKDFNLMSFSDLKGWGCKVPQDELKKLLSPIDPSGQIGLDCSIVPLSKFPGLFSVATTDFFFPLVDDPYRQGEIAAANVLSDMYALGVADVDTVLMSLALSLKMSPAERGKVAGAMMKGFSDKCREAGTAVTGGQTIFNPWCIIGGVAMATCRGNEFLLDRFRCRAGDVLVLTKPLGTQVAVNAYERLLASKANAKGGESPVPPAREVVRMYKVASASMARLNRAAARLLARHGARAATDVTGFGLVGHLRALAEAQRAELRFVVRRLPVLRGALAADEARGRVFRLREGLSSETSGGILAVLSRADATNFCSALEAEDGWPCFVVGRVEDGAAGAEVAVDVEVVEV